MRYDGLLPYEFVEEPTKTHLIDHAGLLPYLDLACVLEADAAWWQMMVLAYNLHAAFDALRVSEGT